MGPSVCRNAPREATRRSPLILRYLLHAHGGFYDEARAKQIQRKFVDRPAFEITKSRKPHQQFQVRRKASSGAQK